MNNLESKYNIAKLLKAIPAECYKLLNNEQLKKFSESPLVEIGSHGYSHLNLAYIPKEVAEEELEKSKQKLEAITGKEVISIAYPDGNYNEEVKSSSLNAGYKNLLAVNYLLPSDSADKNILPRNGLSNTTTYEANMILLNKKFNQVGF